MMKVITIFLLAVSFYCFQNNIATKEIAEKAKKIRAEMLHGKSLPPSITKPKDFSGYQRDETFFYYIERKENNFVDSIQMIVTIFLEDSLQHILSFDEVHLKDSKTYLYKVNKEGVIDWAYKADDPENLKTENIEINTDSA